jgi:SMC interacting uncharacterized protein involved in chromosome segregation
VCFREVERLQKELKQRSLSHEHSLARAESKLMTTEAELQRKDKELKAALDELDR